MEFLIFMEKNYWSKILPQVKNQFETLELNIKNLEHTGTYFFMLKSSNNIISSPFTFIKN